MKVDVGLKVEREKMSKKSLSKTDAAICPIEKVAQGQNERER